MKRLARRIAWAVLLTPGLTSAQDDRARLEVSVLPSTKVWVGQRFVVRTRVVVDEDFFSNKAIQILRRKLDLPVQIDAPWMRELEGARIDASGTDRNASTRSIAAGGDLAFVTRASDGSYVLETRAIADRPGRLTFAAPTLRYAWTTRFETDFLGDPRPVDRKLSTVRGNAVEVLVQPLPADDVPASFQGAVGMFRLTASLGARGTTIPFELTVEGEGDFSRLTAPKLGTFHGLHVRGVRELRSRTSLTVRAELVVTDPSDAFVPAIEFSWFDPKEARYVTRSTEPLVVSGPGPGTTKVDENDRDAATSKPREDSAKLDILDALRPLTPDTRAEPLSWFTIWLLVLTLPWLVTLVFQSMRRIREHLGRRLRGPAALAARVRTAVHATARGHARDVETHYVEYLAKLVQHTPTATVYVGLPRALASAGYPREVARDAEDALRGLMAERYGGSTPPDLGTRVVDVVDRLEDARSR